MILLGTGRMRLAEALGVAGVSLILLSLLSMLGNVGLALTVETGVYYYTTSAGTITYVNITVSGNTSESYTAELYASEIPMNISMTFLSDNSTVEVLVGNLTEAQLLALGAGSVKGYRVFAMLDLKVSKTYTGAAPQVVITFLVPEEDIRAYYWDGSRWVEVPGQTIATTSGGYLLSVPVTGTVFDPPMILGFPSPVGGVLLPGGGSLVSILLLVAGMVLLATSAVVMVMERRRRIKGF